MIALPLALALAASAPPDCGRETAYGLLLPVPNSTVTAGAVVWSRSSDAQLVDVSGPEWTVVEVQAEALLPYVERLTPKAPLMPGHRYQVRSGVDVTRADASTEYGAFDVVEGGEPAPPEAPAALTTRAPSPAGECISAGVEVALASPAAATLTLAVRGDELLALSNRDVLSVEGDAGAAMRFDVVTVDAHGRRSDARAVEAIAEDKTWSEGAPCAGPFGCAATGADGAIPALVALAGLALLRHRRAR